MPPSGKPSANKPGGRRSRSAAIIASQRVKTTETKGERGHAANKKVTGRKRQLLVDVMGLLLVVLVHKADIQERVVLYK